MGRNSSNLGYQITSAISACTAEGQSKRAYKNAHNGQTDYKIFGLTYKNDLCQTGKEMARFIHERYPDVKMVREIRPHMVQEYLDSKTETAGSRATVEMRFCVINTGRLRMGRVSVCLTWNRRRKSGVRSCPRKNIRILRVV